MEQTLKILYQDDNFIAVDKPAGIIVVDDRWDKGKITLRSMVESLCSGNKVWIVHRLDKETSGVILFAKNPEAHRYANILFEQRDLDKEYHAVVQGVITKDADVIDKPIKEDIYNPGRVIIHSQGKPSVTEFAVLERFRGFTYIKALPQTGRMHQIRIHMTAYGNPLAVDTFYGGAGSVKLSQLKSSYKFKKDRPEKPLIARLTLHARRLSFAGMNGQRIDISADMPRDLDLLLKYLRKECQA
jgi:RluA family pseudouridine synthase